MNTISTRFTARFFATLAMTAGLGTAIIAGSAVASADTGSASETDGGSRGVTTSVPAAGVTERKAGKGQLEYLKIELKEAIITG